MHRSDSSILQFGYHDGGGHGYFKESDKYVVIGIASLVYDVTTSVRDCMSSWLGDEVMRARLAVRLPLLYQMLPVRPLMQIHQSPD